MMFWVCVWMVAITTASSASLPPPPLVVAHRGYSAAAPENTLPALHAAVEAGADGVEIDLQITKDGVVVLFHDPELDRTTNCTGPISEYNYHPSSGPPYLSSCDAGAWFSPEFAGTPIPTLAQGLDVTLAAGMLMVLDMKQTGAGIGALLADVIPDPAVQATTIASCWTQEQRDEVTAHLNATRVQVLASEIDGFNNNPEAFWAQMALGRVDGFSLSRKVVDAAFVKAAHKHFMSVAVWTVNEEDDMDAAILAGVDAILTDYVGRLNNVIARRGGASGGGDGGVPSGYSRNSTVVLASILCLLLGAVIVVALFLGARYYLRRSRRRPTEPFVRI